MKKKIVKWTGTALTVLILLGLLQRLVMPKYMSETIEGNMVAEYYGERKDHDVIFIGDCEVYENFSPAVLWEEYGINSYIRGSAEQLLWHSYYLLEDTFKYETPDVVVFNVLALEFNEPRRESYNRMTLDGMRWSLSKVKCIAASMTEGEHFLDYVFPLLRYHSRIRQLKAEDLEYFWKREKVSHNGFLIRADVLPAENVPTGRPLADYTFGENAMGYLDKMTELCENRGVELVLIKAPSLYPYWYEEWEEQVEAYAEAHGLKYYNFLEVSDEIGLDFSLDTYDRGLHLNLSGAEKLTRYFGQILAREIGLEDRRGEAALEQEWAEKLGDYRAEIERQLEALAEGRGVGASGQ